MTWDESADDFIAEYNSALPNQRTILTALAQATAAGFTWYQAESESEKKPTLFCIPGGLSLTGS